MRGATGLGLLLLASAPLAPANAIAVKVIYVNTYGSDTAGCGGPSVIACKTLQYAHDQAGPGDTLLLVTPGDYGPATIKKSLTIQGTTGAGSFMDGAKSCLSIKAPATASVTISEFTCRQTGTGNGIDVLTAARVTLSRVQLSGAPGAGMGFNVDPGNTIDVFVRDTSVVGFRVGVNFDVKTGVVAGASLRDTVVAYSTYGIAVTSTGNAQVTISECVVTKAEVVAAQSISAGSHVYMSNSVLSNSARALKAAAGGELISLGKSNSLVDNNINGTFTATLPTK